MAAEAEAAAAVAVAAAAGSPLTGCGCLMVLGVAIALLAFVIRSSTDAGDSVAQAVGVLLATAAARAAIYAIGDGRRVSARARSSAAPTASTVASS